MLPNAMRQASLICLLPVLLNGCGTYVPSVEEVWEQRGGTTKSLERKIKEQVFCELTSAIYRLNNDPKKKIETGSKEKPPLPTDWGVTVILTMTILEDSALSPNDTLSTPYKPVSTYPSGVKVTTPQSFSLGFGGTLSSDATRIDKFTFFYQVKDLEVDTGNCVMKDEQHPNGRVEADLQGSSLLLESDLGIYDWIDNATTMRASRGVPAKSKQEALSYDIKFDVLTSFNVTPTLKLVRNSIQGGPNLFSTKRERTHELQLTFGPVDPASTKKGQTLQPGTLAAFDSLSLQIGSAVSNGARNLLAQPQ